MKHRRNHAIVQQRRLASPHVIPGTLRKTRHRPAWADHGWQRSMPQDQVMPHLHQAVVNQRDQVVDRIVAMLRKDGWK